MNNIIETNLQYKDMDERQVTEKVIIHHAAISNCSPEQIHSWHLANGWCGAGYHFLVKKDGTIYRLRPEEKVGAHAFGANYNSIGICAEGNYENEEMPKEQKDSICELIKYIFNKYKIYTLQKHKDVNATQCPGKRFPVDEIMMCINAKTSKPIEKKTMGKIANIQKEINKKYKLEIAIDNIYGNETKGALVFGLQRELNIQFEAKLKEDKIFGPKTMSKCINVSKGAKGNITYLIQAMLICHSFDIDADGIFGNKTLMSVKEFQRRNNLIIDGIVGKNTFNKLFK